MKGLHIMWSQSSVDQVLMSIVQVSIKKLIEWCSRVNQVLINMLTEVNPDEWVLIDGIDWRMTNDGLK